MRMALNFGKSAELQAAYYLQGIGWYILAKNYHCRGAEIDIIALRERILIFVEVRARQKSSLVSPEESISKGKIKYLCRGARYFLSQTLHQVEEIADQIRFDVIAVEPGRKIKHIENAFTADWH